MKIGIASDHRGFELKQKLRDSLAKLNYEVDDYGTFSEDSVDYPDFGIKLGEEVASKNDDFGIAICGSELVLV